MYRDPKTGIYYVSLTGKSGTRTRRSTGTSDFKLAKEIETTWKMERLRVDKLGETPLFTFDEIAVWYLKEESPKLRAHADNVGTLRILAPYFRGRPVASISDDEILAFKAARRGQGVSDKTIRRNLAVFSSMLEKAAKGPYRGIPNPVKGHLPVVHGDDHRIRWEEKPVIHRLATMCETVVADAVILAAYSGLRQGEIRNLEWARVDLHRNLIHLTPDDQKNKRYSTVPINETVRGVLLRRKRWCAENRPDCRYVFSDDKGKPLAKEYVYWRFQKAVEAEGIQDFTFHDLRHCFCTWLILAGVDMRIVKELARHRDLRTTEKYIYLSTEHLKAPISALDRQDSVRPSPAMPGQGGVSA